MQYKVKCFFGIFHFIFILTLKPDMISKTTSYRHIAISRYFWFMVQDTLDQRLDIEGHS